MSDFIHFVADNANNSKICQEFTKELGEKSNKNKLQLWFKEHGYDVSLQECQELINKKDNIIKLGDTVKVY